MGYLIFSAALALALFGAGVAAQWTARRNNDEVLQRVEVLAREGRVEDALGVAHALQGASAAVLIAGFTRATEAEAEIAMERARGAQRDTIGWYVSALDRLSLAGQLLAAANALYLLVLIPGGPGFFDRFAQGMALTFCGMGLSMAIPATVGRFWLLSRIRRLAIDMEKAAAVVYNTAR